MRFREKNRPECRFIRIPACPVCFNEAVFLFVFQLAGFPFHHNPITAGGGTCRLLTSLAFVVGMRQSVHVGNQNIHCDEGADPTQK